MTNHVPTLETAKKMKAAGFHQGTLHVWYRYGGTSAYELGRSMSKSLMDSNFVDWVAAPMATEILPEFSGGCRVSLGVENCMYSVNVSSVNFVSYENGAEATALLWIYHKQLTNLQKGQES